MLEELRFQQWQCCHPGIGNSGKSPPTLGRRDKIFLPGLKAKAAWWEVTFCMVLEERGHAGGHSPWWRGHVKQIKGTVEKYQGSSVLPPSGLLPVPLMNWSYPEAPGKGDWGISKGPLRHHVHSQFDSLTVACHLNCAASSNLWAASTPVSTLLLKTPQRLLRIPRCGPSQLRCPPDLNLPPLGTYLF